MNQTASCDVLRPQAIFLEASAGNPKGAAIGDLYERHSRQVYMLCLRMTRNATDAEDLTQEVFLQLLRKIDSFRGESQFTTWLHRLTVNQVLMYFRRVKARKERMVEDVEAEISILHRRRESSRSQVVNKIALETALAQVAPGQRLVFVLYDIEGYNHEEIACMLGHKVGTSKSQLHKARQKLRRLLNGERLERP
jgi:RNA polymerase sigma-70 factor, ECF subfamily